MTALRRDPAVGAQLPLAVWPAAIVAAVAITYATGLSAPFIFDDAGAVVHNPSIREVGWAALQPPEVGSTTTGRPVTNLSFAIDHALTGGKPAGYRLTNLLIHAAAALALFALVRRTLESAVGRASGLPAAGTAGTVALLWAVHPLQTESVTCIAQRTEALCGLFLLLTLAAFARGAFTGRKGWLAVAVGLSAVGMGVKEVMVVAPVVVFLYDRTFVAGTFAGAWRARRVFYCALAATWLPLAGLVMQGEGARGAAAGFGRGLSSWHYLLTQAEALVTYLKLSVWPHPLVLDYGTGVVTSLAEVWWQGVIVLALLGATVWALVRRPVAGFLGAGFFLILAPSSSVVPLVTQTIAEHRMYLPLAAVLLAGAGLLQAMIMRRPRVAAVGAGLAAVVLGALTIARNLQYRDEVTIWADNVAKLPSNPRGHLNLALALAEAGDISSAEHHFDRAVALDQDYVMAHYNRGSFLFAQGRWEASIEALRRAVELAPDHADAHVNLGNALVRAGRPAEALGHYGEAMRLAPDADVAFNHGQALVALGRAAEARARFEAALKLDPGLAAARQEIARLEGAAATAGDPEQSWRERLRANPADAGAHARLGLWLARSGRLAEAAEHLEAAVRLEAGDVDARANLGNVRLLQGRFDEAIACYEAVVRARPDDRRAHENLALARQAKAGGG